MEVSAQDPIQGLFSLNQEMTQNLSDSAQGYLALISILKDMIRIAHTYGGQIFGHHPHQSTLMTTRETIHNHFNTCTVLHKDINMMLHTLQTNPLTSSSSRENRLLWIEGKRAIQHSQLMHRDFQMSAGQIDRSQAVTLTPDIPIQTGKEAIAYQDEIVIFFCPQALDLIEKAINRADLTNAIIHISEEIECAHNIDMAQTQKWAKSVKERAVKDVEYMVMHIEKVVFPLQTGSINRTFNIPPRAPGA